MSDTYTARPDLAGKAKDMVRDVKAKASDLTDGSRAPPRTTPRSSATPRSTWQTRAKDKVEAAVSQRKSLGADYIGSIAQATGRAAQ